MRATEKMCPYMSGMDWNCRGEVCAVYCCERYTPPGSVEYRTERCYYSGRGVVMGEYKVEKGESLV